MRVQIHQLWGQIFTLREQPGLLFPQLSSFGSFCKPNGIGSNIKIENALSLLNSIHLEPLGSEQSHYQPGPHHFNIDYLSASHLLSGSVDQKASTGRALYICTHTHTHFIFNMKGREGCRSPAVWIKGVSRSIPHRQSTQRAGPAVHLERINEAPLKHHQQFINPGR